MVKSKTEEGRFAYEGLDRVIHEKARLSVLTSLVAHPKGLVFGDLKQMCGLTDGNLSRHLTTLEEAGYLTQKKGFEGRKPRTWVAITKEGRSALEREVAALRDLNDRTAKAHGTVAGD